MNIILYAILISSFPITLKGLYFEPVHDEYFTNSSKQKEETLPENGENMLTFHGMMKQYLQSRNISVGDEQAEKLDLFSNRPLFGNSSGNASEVMTLPMVENEDEPAEDSPGFQDIHNATYEYPFSLNKTLNASEVDESLKYATLQEDISNRTRTGAEDGNGTENRTRTEDGYGIENRTGTEEENGTENRTRTEDENGTENSNGTGTTPHHNEETFENKESDPFHFHIAPIVIYYDDENRTILEKTQSREKTISGMKIKSGHKAIENILTEDEEIDLQNKFDPRKETCFQVFENCSLNQVNITTGRDCLAQCERGFTEGFTANSRTEMSFPEDDTTLSFNGESSAAFQLETDHECSVFDLLFNLRTFQTDSEIISMKQGETELNVVLKNGKLGTRFFCQNISEEHFMEIGGIQDGNLHLCYILVDQKNSEIVIQVNERREKFALSNETVNEICQIFREEGKTELVFGGKTHGSNMTSNDIETGFIGCISNASVFIGSKFVSLTSSEEIQKIQLSKIKTAEKCLESMKAISRICSNGMECEDTITNRKTCNNGKTVSIITFNGFNYLSYRLYFGENRIQTFSNEFSFSFKTLFKDAILFYISGEISMTSERPQHLSISLTEEERLFVSFDSGAELISIVIGNSLCDNHWHDVIVRHKNNKIQLILDGSSEIRELRTNDKFFFDFDPLVFVGGFPNLEKDCAIRPRNISSVYKNCEEMSQKYVYNIKDESCENITVYNCEDQDKTEVKIFDDEDECLETCYVKGLSSFKYFSGCLRDVMINGEEVLKRTSQVREINFKGKSQMLEADCDCNMEEESLVSFLTHDSYLNLYRDSSNESFSISFKVKSKGGKILQGVVYSQNGVYPWKLKFEEERMILTLSTPDKVHLVSPQDLGKKDWLEVVLTLDGKNLSLVVNNQRDSMSLDKNITIDDKLTFAGFIGCLKAIALDGNPQDLRSYIGTSVSRDVVGGCQETLLATAEDCPTGTFCSVQSTFDCEKDIYQGNCHLVKYRKSCGEYRLLGYKESGQFIIDSDGEGPLNPTEVFCEFHKNGDTFTVVDHNIPQRFTNVKNKAKHFLVNVQYREFTAEGLRYLISTSEECYQDVKISCGDMTTFYKQVSFSSAFLAGIDYLGDRHFGVCHCTGFEDCYQSTSQNSTNKNGYRIVNQTALPILQLKIQREDSDNAPYSEPNLSIGKLYCKNNEIKNEPIAFLFSKSSLILSPWIEGELLLRFRTSSNKGNIFYQPSISRNSPFIRASLQSENSLNIQYGMPSKSQSVTFTTSYPINEGQWNTLWIDVVQNSFRIIFNDQIKFSTFNNENIMHLMDGFFILGNIPKEYRNDKDRDIDNGLIGCYSPIRLNNKALNTSELISNSYKSQEILLGCKGACDENPCQNGATCLEKWTSYECSCVNPFAHLGINCENNLNTNAVTLFSSTEAVYYNSGFVDESVSPLTSNFTFNIKTNEPNCLLFVAMDYLQNIIQIHLENSTMVILLLNFGDELEELKIDTGEYSLNKGQSVQIVVERFRNKTDLLVFALNQTFSATLDRGVTLITEEGYKQYPYEVQNQLIQYQHSFTVPEKFSLIFIGGVKSYGATTNLPGLIGCFRGLKINETIMNFSDEISWNLGNGVTHGCKSKCDERGEVCRNGGSCSDTFNSTSDEGSFVCNCEGTSYIGLHCDEEIAYTFNGREDGIGLMGWSFPYNETLRISFAFKSESFESPSYLLLFLKLNNTRSSESENISIVLHDDRILLKSWRGQEIYLENNFEELQERHFVQVTFNSSEILFSVDEKTVSSFGSFTNSSSFVNASEEDPAKNDTSFGLIIGGAPVYILQELQEDFKNFKGCISNLRIRSSFVDFSPLEDYQNGKNFVRFGLPKFGRCSVFYDKETAPIFYDFSKISNWKAPEPDIREVPLQSAVRSVELSFESSSFYPDTTTNPSNVTEFVYDTSTAKIWPWALLGSVFFLLVLLLLVLLLKRCCQKSKKEQKDLERVDSDPTPRETGAQVEEELLLVEGVPFIKTSRPINSIGSMPFNQTPSEILKKEEELAEEEPLLPEKRRNAETRANNSAGSMPFSQTPSENFKKKDQDTGKREDNPLLQSREEIKPKTEALDLYGDAEDDQLKKTPEQSSKPIEIPLNSINRDSKAKIPFKNQLSSDANALRHIDSSSSEDSISSLPYYSSEKKPSNIDLTLEDNEDNNYNTYETKDNIDNDQKGNPNIEQSVDMKKFYLSRKASEPPKLPPKAK